VTFGFVDLISGSSWAVSCHACYFNPSPTPTPTPHPGGPDQVAEITGRKCRLERDEDGNLVEVNRAKALGCTQKRVNLNEMAAFQRGDKLVSIISEAGSTGISLHADRRAGNQR